MLNPQSLLREVIDRLNSIPEISAECSIEMYEDSTASRRSVGEAVGAMSEPSMLAAHLATSLGERGEVQAWRHEFTIFIRPYDDAQAYRIFQALVSGQAADFPVEAQYMKLHEDCDPMESISFNRATNTDGVEYFTFSFALTEIGG